MNWQVQEAKQRFSALVRQAVEERPQMVTRHGEEVVVVLSAVEYHRLRGNVPNFKEFLTTGPDLDALELQRDRGLPRDVEL